MNEAWSTYLMHARDAVQLFEFHPMMVPWPVQTTQYTAALLGEGVVEAAVSDRHEAVSLLRVQNVELLLHEWALRSPVGDVSTMSEQLHHLLRISVRSDLSVRVVPVGNAPHNVRHGAFTLLDYAKHPSVVYREDPAEGVLSDDECLVDIYRSTASALAAAALDERESRELIGRIAVELYGGHEDEIPPLRIVRV